MGNGSSLIASVVLTTILATVPATAQTYDQLKVWCYKSDLNNPDVNNSDFNNLALANRNIQGCDAVIASGRENQVNLTIALFDRGWAYITKGQYDRAIPGLRSGNPAPAGVLHPPSSTAASLVPSLADIRRHWPIARRRCGLARSMPKSSILGHSPI